MTSPPPLSRKHLHAVRGQIEAQIVPVMEAIYREKIRSTDGPYRPADVLPPTAFPLLKPKERTVCYFDYGATGISVLAPLAAAGDARAATLVKQVLANTFYYVRKIHRQWRDGDQLWETPLRRLLAHLAWAWPHLEALLPAAELRSLEAALTAQVEVTIEHNHRFWPGVRGWLFLACNNHTAIFAQGVWACGQALRRPDWVGLAEDFAQRYIEDMHPDGYFDENAQPERLGGPSMLYTPLTAGSLYDILDGRHRRQAQFLKAACFFRRFLDHGYGPIPIADERTNFGGRASVYGLALHSLTPEGRGMLRDLFSQGALLAQPTPEGLAVLYHELGLMRCGPTATPENHLGGDVRITLPLGILRRKGWTAGLCGLRATNREFAPDSDYALDQQSHVFLAHRTLGTLLPGTKGKRQPDLSTCRRGDDAYTIATGELLNGPDRLSVNVHYRTFDVRIAWRLESGRALLTFESGTDEETTTTLPLTAVAESALRLDAPHEFVEVPGFSPYSDGNRDSAVRALRVRWQGCLELAFQTGASA